eukprot:249506-Karenia_brevis.AAC.1
MMGSPELWDKDQGRYHLLGWKSGRIRRTCRSIFKAEIQGMCYTHETGVCPRATLTELAGPFEQD